MTHHNFVKIFPFWLFLFKYFSLFDSFPKGCFSRFTSSVVSFLVKWMYIPYLTHALPGKQRCQPLKIWILHFFFFCTTSHPQIIYLFPAKTTSFNLGSTVFDAKDLPEGGSFDLYLVGVGNLSLSKFTLFFLSRRIDIFLIHGWVQGEKCCFRKRLTHQKRSPQNFAVFSKV